MSTRKLIFPIVAVYLFGMAAYYFLGDSSDEWTFEYYGVEKLFSAAAFFLLALESHSRYIIKIALYATAVCLFMLCFHIYTMLFGYSSTVLVGSFLLYTLIVLFLLYNKRL